MEQIKIRLLQGDVPVSCLTEVSEAESCNRKLREKSYPSGKTTLARTFVPIDSVNYFDLEDHVSLIHLDEPMTAMRDLSGLVVIDEIQRRPDLFPLLRILADRQPLLTRFLILGSASPDLVRDASELLAGRLETIPVGGFSLAEVGQQEVKQHWLRGGFPLSYLAASDSDSRNWRKNFIQTFLERDLPQRNGLRSYH